MRDYRKVNPARLEQEYKKRLDTKTETHAEHVVLMGFKFRKPRYWDNPIQLSRLLKIMKQTALVMLVVVLGIHLSILVINDKKQEWNLFTYNIDGEVRWTRAIKLQ